MFDVNQLIVVLVAVGGAVFSAALGWLDSGESFVPRKFASSMLRAFIAGVVFALGYQTLPTIGFWDFILAFLGGAGIDVLGNRLSGAVAAHKTAAQTETEVQVKQ
jgi:hypothetical protein